MSQRTHILICRGQVIDLIMEPYTSVLQSLIHNDADATSVTKVCFY